MIILVDWNLVAYKPKKMDRISLLPDGLLHQILSTLNTQQVVQTCVLSKRWRTLWTRIPVLNFCSDSHKYKCDSNDERMRLSFKQFIFRVLSEHCCTHIQKLSYSAFDFDVVLVELLICYARCRNVQELYIDSDYPGSYDVVYDWKYCFSACSSLTVLKMACGFADNWGTLVLPSLKIVEIECNLNEYGEVEMFSGCPNLESLVLIDFYFRSARIYAPKLDNFELCVSDDWFLTSPNLELLAPNLKTVKFSNILPIVTSALYFSCIHKVSIELEDSTFKRENSLTREEAAANFCEVLRVFYNATTFLLPMEIQVDLPRSSLSGISFHNLEHLKLKTKVTNKVTLIDLPITILAFIRKCPNLESLTVLNKDNVYRPSRCCFCC